MPTLLFEPKDKFPPVSEADTDGLLAFGGSLSQKRLLKAYRSGIFPWPVEDFPMLWFAPNPRFVLFPEKFKTSKSFRQFLRKTNFKVKFDTCFAKVITNCSLVDRGDDLGTWINSKMIQAYIKLHMAGYAHSVEVFDENELVGGLYGVSVGGVFCGESMFFTKSNASKFALYHLVEKAKKFKFHFIDAQVETEHLLKQGAENIPREEFMHLLEKALKNKTKKGKWTFKD